MKTNFSKASTGAALFASTLLTYSIAHAVPSTINDDYWGGNDNGWGDVIGKKSLFDIHSMTVEKLGSTLSVKINTNFAGRGNDHLFDSLTNGQGIGYGDLFLSTQWTPFGAAPYADDDHATGTKWQYGFSLDNRWMDEALAGTGKLYSLNSGNNNADTLLSDDFLTGGTFRNGQEIAVDTASNGVAAVAGNSSSWDITAGQVNFLIDLTGTDLLFADEIALHWGMTCGNDTIEGAYSVPEPTIAALLATGLLGLGIAGKTRRR